MSDSVSGSDPRTTLPESYEQKWDTYIGFVDDAPASVLLDLGLEEVAPIEPLGLLHFWSVDMADPGPHGMGTGEEAEAFAAIEDAVSELAGQAGLLQVGRLRNHGYWQLSYYGAEDLSAELGSIAHAHLSPTQRQSLKVGTDEDPQWGYYLNFLCPSTQQRQWMSDRSVVAQLMDHGDPLTPRPVDHYMYFALKAQAQAVARLAGEQGFQAAVTEPHEDNPNWAVHAIREDSAELGHIHGVVMALVTMSEDHEGVYGGWGAPLVSAPKDAPN